MGILWANWHAIWMWTLKFKFYRYKYPKSHLLGHVNIEKSESERAIMKTSYIEVCWLYKTTHQKIIEQKKLFCS